MHFDGNWIANIGFRLIDVSFYNFSKSRLQLCIQHLLLVYAHLPPDLDVGIMQLDNRIFNSNPGPWSLTLPNDKKETHYPSTLDQKCLNSNSFTWNSWLESCCDDNVTAL